MAVTSKIVLSRSAFLISLPGPFHPSCLSCLCSILSLLDQVTCLPDEEVRGRGVRSYSGSLPRPRTSGGRQVLLQNTNHKGPTSPTSNAGQEEHARGQASQCKVNCQHLCHQHLSSHTLRNLKNIRIHEIWTMSQVLDCQVGTSESKIWKAVLNHSLGRSQEPSNYLLSSAFNHSRSWTSLGSSRNTMDDDLILAVGSRGRGKGEFTNPQVC